MFGELPPVSVKDLGLGQPAWIGHGLLCESSVDVAMIAHRLVQGLVEGQTLVWARRQTAELLTGLGCLKVRHRICSCRVRHGLVGLLTQILLPLVHRPRLQGVVPAADMALPIDPGQP